MRTLLFTFVFMAMCCGAFIYMFEKDRSRYRNCYLMILAMLSIFPFLWAVGGDVGRIITVILFDATLIAILIVPFFLIINGFVMIKKEGRRLAHMLSLGLGVMILVGEIATVSMAIRDVTSYYSEDPVRDYYLNGRTIIELFISLSVIYFSVSFLVFMIYVVFLQIIPKRKNFDYIIIHGAGLLDGDRVPRLLGNRIDKAIDVYRKDDTPTKIIPSGGQGYDESISEAEAMKRYLIEKGIPEEDIILEDKSTTTLENIKFSMNIIEQDNHGEDVALVTSNYHVYRALRYARKCNLKCTGIGSHVAFYYWPSALIREYIAIHAEKKHAIMLAAGYVAMLGLTFYMIYSQF